MSILSATLRGVFRPARSLWRRLPTDFRYRLWEIAGPSAQRVYAGLVLARPSDEIQETHALPIVVAGLFSTANGIGEAARSTYRALEAAGLNPIAVDLSEKLAPVDLQCEIECHPMSDAQQGILILQLNGPETQSALEHLKMRRGRDWYTIGYWAWELPTFPNSWERAFKFLSEIWTISSFSAEALGQHPNAPPIRVIHHAIEGANALPNRAAFGIPDDAFCFLLMADSMSSMARKNPFSAIRAFRDAFGRDRSKHLIIKTRNLDRQPEAAQDISDAIGDAPNISLIDQSLSETDLWCLMNSCDAFVSLHRSEGFGLVIAQAMALGKPVIVTNWSGNLDFTTPETAFLVDSALIETDDKYGVYSKFVSEWADPDHCHAVEQFKCVANDADERAKRSRAGQAHVRSELSTLQIGQPMRDALRQPGLKDAKLS